MEPLVILVVEDEEVMRRSLVRMLSRDPRVKIVEAADGLDALKVMEAQAVDVVISDEVMPRINGVRLLETIKGRWPGTRRVLYSGRIDADVVMDAINRGGVDKALSKGMPAEAFRAEVDELIAECLAKRLDGADARGSSGHGAGGAGAVVDSERPPPSVLVLADELALRRAIEEALRGDGFDVRSTGSTLAPSALTETSREVVVLDLSGVLDIAAVLRGIREQDLDCPIIVLVGRNDVAQAHEALRLGAHRYLVHPVARDSLTATVNKAATLRRLSQARRAAVSEMRGDGLGLGDRAGLEVRFGRAMERLFMVYQPIVSWSEQRVIGYEALVRSEEPSMPHPGLLLDAANRLGRMEELSHKIRRISHQPLRSLPDSVALFLNLDVKDLASADLIESELADMAERIVLEITERASLERVDGLQAQVSALRARGYRIAIDDLGAGYAGLSSFALLDPDLVKLDMSLVRDVHTSATKRRLVKSLQEACRDLGVPMVAEGVETGPERDALIAAGCDIFQGFLFARPARELPDVLWD